MPSETAFPLWRRAHHRNVPHSERQLKPVGHLNKIQKPETFTTYSDPDESTYMYVTKCRSKTRTDGFGKGREYNVSTCRSVLVPSLSANPALASNKALFSCSNTFGDIVQQEEQQT